MEKFRTPKAQNNLSFVHWLDFGTYMGFLTPMGRIFFFNKASNNGLIWSSLVFTGPYLGLANWRRNSFLITVTDRTSSSATPTEYGPLFCELISVLPSGGAAGRGSRHPRRARHPVAYAE